LLSCDREAIERCFEFILAETRGVWHGRARAMMCRRLKHCEIAPERRQRLVDCIMNRLVSGDFSEQFQDQLRLAIHLDPERTFKLAHRCLIEGTYPPARAMGRQARGIGVRSPLSRRPTYVQQVGSMPIRSLTAF
jgi:hypothetical protein